MDKQDIGEVKTKLLEINKLVTQLDPSIRAAAFEILKPYYFSHKQAKGTGDVGATDPNNEPDTHDLGTFISSFDSNKPSDNLMTLVAWLYSNYGAYPITMKEIKELADSCGVIVPNRSDNTMKALKVNGKSLFSQQGKGFKVTVSGELYLKETYKVKKGNKPIPKE